MNVNSKKYFSISEVSELTGVPAHKLRYLEKSNIMTDVCQIRGRRYYTNSDIEFIKQNFTKPVILNQLTLFTPVNENPVDIINKIDDLINKFSSLKLK